MNIQQMSVSERILLAQELWESVVAKADDISVTKAQAELLDSRLRALASDGNAGESWDVVKQRILGV